MASKIYARLNFALNVINKYDKGNLGNFENTSEMNP